jgi:hypothetical protein
MVAGAGGGGGGGDATASGPLCDCVGDIGDVRTGAVLSGSGVGELVFEGHWASSPGDGEVTVENGVPIRGDHIGEGGVDERRDSSRDGGRASTDVGGRDWGVDCGVSTVEDTT